MDIQYNNIVDVFFMYSIVTKYIKIERVKWIAGKITNELSSGAQGVSSRFHPY